MERLGVAFHNYDGVYWSIYTRNVSLLETVKQDMAGIDKVTVVECTWRETILMPEEEHRQHMQKFYGRS
jgi:hypothetical protein